MRKWVFPYEDIKVNSKILIYGAGYIGNDYGLQILNNDFCKIVGYVDSRAVGKVLDVFSIYRPNTDLKHLKFDYILIAIRDVEERIIIQENLVKIGIPKEKIICHIIQTQEYSTEDGELKIIHDDDESNSIYFCIELTGGIGDYIVEKKMVETLINIEPKLTFDIVGKLDVVKSIYSDMNSLKRIFLSKNNIEVWKEYDAVIRITHIMDIQQLCIERLERKSKDLFNVMQSCIVRRGELAVDEVKYRAYKDVIFLKRAKFRNLNRYTMYSHCGIFTIKNQKVNLELNKEYKDDFDGLNLPNNYITINRGADKILDGRTQTKIWPKEYYHELLKLLKNSFPDFTIVQIGVDKKDKLIGIDRHIFGESLEIIKYVLKNSKLHVDCEGGMVHMATQLETKCVVLFGPTPEYYYGYKQNINIVSHNCSECMGITKDWFTHCYIGDEEPRCMKSIMPQEVFEKIKEYLEKNKSVRI